MIEMFLKALAQERSAATVRGYGWDLAQLARWVQARYGVAAVNWHSIGYEDLLDYLHERLQAGVSGAARKRETSAFKAFFCWLYGSDSHPASRLKYPKVTRKKQRWHRPQTIIEILAACDPGTPTGLRDLALLALAYETGLRAAELCRLKLADVSMPGRQLSVVVKGGDVDARYFSDQCALNLANWLAVRGQVLKAVQLRSAPPTPHENGGRAPCDTFFCSIHQARPLTTDGLRVIFRRIARRAGIEGGFSPHDLRRSFAQALNAQSAPDRTAMAAGGWLSEDVYHGYVQDVNPEHIRQYSPLDWAMRSAPLPPAEYKHGPHEGPNPLRPG